MAHSRKDENRALDAAERELVDKSHHPQIQDLSDTDLSDLLKLVRERRDKAQAATSRQRREMRGKAAPRASRATSDNTGTRVKTEVLAMAVRRLNSEQERRARIAARDQLVANAQNALSMRDAASKTREPRSSAPRKRRTPITSQKSSQKSSRVSGAKVGSVSQQNKRAQAKRDS